ncbi:MAG: hypothetical protein ABIK65_11145 [Candidatus Eisenbacteria bacterium]
MASGTSRPAELEEIGRRKPSFPLRVNEPSDRGPHGTLTIGVQNLLQECKVDEREARGRLHQLVESPHTVGMSKSFYKSTFRAGHPKTAAMVLDLTYPKRLATRPAQRCRCFQKDDPDRIKPNRRSAAVTEHGAVVPNRMRRSQQLECRMVAEDSLRTGGCRDQVAIWLEASRQNSRRHNGEQAASHCLDPPPPYMVLQLITGGWKITLLSPRLGELGQ